MAYHYVDALYISENGARLHPAYEAANAIEGRLRREKFEVRLYFVSSRRA